MLAITYYRMEVEKVSFDETIQFWNLNVISELNSTWPSCSQFCSSLPHLQHFLAGTKWNTLMVTTENVQRLGLYLRTEEHPAKGKWARLKAGKGESEQEKFEPKTVSPSLIMLAHFFWFLFTPHLGSRTKCDLGNPNNRLAITDSQLHALGANKMWTLGAKKLSLSDYKTFLCFFSLPFIFLIFFGSFIILVSSILSFLLLLGSLIYALWEPKKGVNLGSQTTVILPPLFFHSSPLLDIGS